MKYEIENGILLTCEADAGESTATIPADVQVIGANAFAGCRKISEVSIPNSVIAIGKEAFASCAMLKSIIIPSSVTAIDQMALYGIEDITIYETMNCDFRAKKWEMMDATHTIPLFGAHSTWVSVSNSPMPDFRQFNVLISVIKEDGSVKYKIPLYCRGEYFNAVFDYIECWKSCGEFDFEKFDSLFANLKKPENKRKIALTRLNWPYLLPNETQKIYAKYLSKYVKEELNIALENNDMHTIDTLLKNELLTAKNIDECLQLAQEKNNADVTALLTEYKEKKIGTTAPKKEPKKVEKKIDSADKPLSLADLKKIWTFKNETNVKGKEYVTITKYKGTDADVVVPDVIGKLPVCVIGEKAFASNLNIKQISLPSSIESIGYQAFFGCTNLEKINVSTNNIISIAEDAFSKCDKLADKNGYVIINDIFCDCFSTKSKSIVIPDGVKYVSFNFQHCPNVASITIPESVNNWGYAAFANCKKLTSLIIKCNPENMYLNLMGSPNVAVSVPAGGKAEEFVKKSGFKFKTL